MATEGADGIIKGAAFAAVGSHLTFGAGDKVKVKWMQGGEEKEIEITPTDTTPEKMSFDFPDALMSVPVDTELTFEFSLGEAVREKDTTLIEG